MCGPRHRLDRDQAEDGFITFDPTTNLPYITIESYPNVGIASISINGNVQPMNYYGWGNTAYWYVSLDLTPSNEYNWTVEVANLCATSQTFTDSFTTDCQNVINGNSQDLGCGCEEPEPQAGYDCLGNCLDDADLDGVCDEFEIEGCTDIQASNFNDLATNDDGSCQYLQIEGCTDSIALNYNEEATSNDGSCVYEILGCTDENACNFNPEANTDNGDCIYPQTSYEEAIACESFQWNGQTYNESGTYNYSEQNNNDYSISFDDYNDRIEVPNIYLGNNFSIMMEVKPNDNNDFGEIINIGGSLALGVDGSLLELNINSTSNNNNWNFDNAFAYNFNDTSWINLCVNYSNDSLYLYYNGNKVLNGYAPNYNISGLLILGDRNMNSYYIVMEGNRTISHYGIQL